MSEISQRYVVLTEGEDNQRNNCTILPGAARVLAQTSIIPVTLDYDHGRIIGSANGFARAGTIEGRTKITFSIRLSASSGMTHDDLRPLKAGVFLTDVFKFRQPGQHLDWVTDALIREISFYDPRPPAMVIE